MPSTIFRIESLQGSLPGETHLNHVSDGYMRQTSTVSSHHGTTIWYTRRSLDGVEIVLLKPIGRSVLQSQSEKLS
jgi:hypothetical protein